MRDGKLFLCAAFWVLLTALRLFFPGETEAARAWVTDTVDPRRSCRAAALQLGRELEAFHPRQRLVEALARGEGAPR